MSVRSKLGRYVAARLLQIIPVTLVILTLVFLLCRLAPGDPVYFIGGASITEEYYQDIRTEFGLDQPLHTQYIIYMQKLLVGDLGFSTFFQEPVLDVVLDRLPNTLLLTFTALLLAAGAGIPLGVVAAKKARSRWDNAISIISLVGYSQPMFWTGMILILVFSGSGVPLSGMTTIGSDSTGFAYLWDLLSHLLLPALTLGFHQMALFSRLTRSSMIDVLSLDFITAARSKGVAEGTLLMRHGLRNALIPIVTLFGHQIGFMFAASALIEIVFAWPGIGSLMLGAVLSRDYALLSGIFLVVSLTVIVTNLITDLLYFRLDPRITSP